MEDLGGHGNFEIIDVRRSDSLIDIHGKDGSTMVTLTQDMKLRFSENYTPDEAARIFWEAISLEGQNMLDLKRENQELKDMLSLYDNNNDKGILREDNPILRLLSDYTPAKFGHANIMNIMMDLNGDVHFWNTESSNGSGEIRIAMSGTRYSNKFLVACQNFYKAFKEEILTTQNGDLRGINHYAIKEE